MLKYHIVVGKIRKNIVNSNWKKHKCKSCYFEVGGVCRESPPGTVKAYKQVLETRYPEVMFKQACSKFHTKVGE